MHKNRIVLGIETSCDETSVSIVKEKMNRYGFKSKIPEMEYRFVNYRKIILDEVNPK